MPKYLVGKTKRCGGDHDFGTCRCLVQRAFPCDPSPLFKRKSKIVTRHFISSRVLVDILLLQISLSAKSAKFIHCHGRFLRCGQSLTSPYNLFKNPTSTFQITKIHLFIQSISPSRLLSGTWSPVLSIRHSRHSVRTVIVALLSCTRKP